MATVDLIRDDASSRALEPQVTSILGSLRRRIRRYLWQRGLAVLGAALCAIFWVSLAIDWSLEPDADARLLLLSAIVVLVLVLVFRCLVRYLVVSLPDRSMAMLLERRFGTLDEGLLTAVELARPHPHRDRFNQAMLARTRAQARAMLQDVDLRAVLNARPLRAAIAAACLLGASVAVFAFAAPAAMATWARRTLLMSAERWPRDTRLVMEGFRDGTMKVAKGSDVTVRVHADLARVVPEEVHLDYRNEAGVRRRPRMQKDGNADPKIDRFQDYSHTFHNVMAPIRFDVVGGDDRLRDLRFVVVDSPVITRMTLHCEFPDYTRRAPRELPGGASVELPEGTRVAIDAKCNKALARVRVVREQGDESSSAHTYDVRPGSRDSRSFRFVEEALHDPTRLSFTLRDADGIGSLRPAQLTLGVIRDSPPQMRVRPQGIGAAITAKARVPVAGTVTDDYGLVRAWFEFAVDEQKPAERPIPVPQDAPTELALDAAFEVEELPLKAGQKLLLSVKAADNNELSGTPGVGSSERLALSLVTPDALLAILASREMNLRRQFETIVDEVTETRRSLEHVGSADAAQPLEGTDREGSLEALRVERALQLCRKNTGEVRGVADAFNTIVAELVNNRIETDELKSRLHDRIALPLSRLAELSFPELETRLERLGQELTKKDDTAAALASANEQADRILADMRQVLEHMRELETFNEAVALLRSIAEAQERLNAQTKERRRQQARELLEE